MIKTKPEDFIVKEIIELKEGKGRYLYVEVEKTNWNTLDLVNKLSDILNISRKNIGFAGYKDKNAVTVQYFSRKKNDFVGALKLLDFKMINFYISAFQSYLFNCVLKEYLKDYNNFKSKYSIGEFLFSKKRIKNFKIPLVNFDFEFRKDKISLIYKKLLKDIKLESFIFKEFPYSVSYSVERDAFADVKDFKYKYEKDEMNKGKYNSVLEFTLPTGSYATVVIKKLFPENL